MNRRQAHRTHDHGQQGAATLSVTLLLLFVLSLMSVYAARVGLTEARLSANELRHQQALAAAMAGLERAFAALDPALLDGPPRAGPAGTLPDGSAYASHLRPEGDFRVEISATGTSTDGGSTRRLRQRARFLPWLRRPPPAALVAREAVRLRGGRLRGGREVPRLWSGGRLFRDGVPVVRLPGDCLPDGLCTGDAALGSLATPAWERQFFTHPPALIPEMPGVIHIAAPSPARLSGLHLGLASRPVLVIVDGDVASLRDSRIHGLLLVRGDITGDAGGLVLEGALLSIGRIALAGDFLIRHRPTVLRRLMDLGRFVPIAGSWQDRDPLP